MRVAVAALIGTITLVLRYLTLRGFPNDHYVHLARVQQVLLGAWPVRDYTEEGVPLTTLASTVAQWVLGAGLWPEAVVTLASLAMAAAVTTYVTSTITGSVVAGAWAGGLQLLAFPRSYSHPKMLVYAVAIAAVWAYAAKPGRLKLLMLAVVAGLAFLVRHDHGLYTGAALAVVVFAVDARTSIAAAARAVAWFTVAALVVASPWLVYVATVDNLVSYFERGIQISRTEAVRTRLSWPRFKPDAEAAAEIVNVRWREHVTEAGRHETELALKLEDGTAIGGRTWRYRLRDRSAAGAHAIVTSPAVEDTMYIDRSAQPGGSSFATPGNAAVLVYYAAIAAPALLLIIATVAWIRRRPVARAPASLALGIAALGLIVSVGFLREVLVERLADVFGVLPVACALLGAAVWNMGAPAIRAVARVTVVLLLATFSAATIRARNVADEIDSSHLLGSGVGDRAQAVKAGLTVWPWPSQWPAGDGWRLAEYANACTRPTDRLVATWNVPELYFFARRGFAGGEAFLIPALRRPDAIEQDFLRRVANEPVPLIFIDRDGWSDVARLYPAIARWTALNYQERGTFTLDNGMVIRVMARADSPCPPPA
ncbi:MAG TPA: hypothetical protein VNJ02_04775 [Vicinamibacterales bacterium]|nr:hypothetical protein [Vicinamibacterales bacterium]